MKNTPWKLKPGACPLSSDSSSSNSNSNSNSNSSNGETKKNKGRKKPNGMAWRPGPCSEADSEWEVIEDDDDEDDY